MDKEIPTGSLWVVLPFISPNLKHHDYGFPPEGVRAWKRPCPPVNKEKLPNIPREQYTPGTILLVGESTTHTDGTEWVQVLTPHQGWINSTHFDRGRGRLLRLS